MPQELITPNLHVVLIHYPLALLVVGVAIELFAFLGWRRSAFRIAGRWMILIGALSLVPAAFSGLYAMAALNRTTPFGSDQLTWAEVRQDSPLSEAAWELMTQHAWSTAIGSVAILLIVVLWMGSSDLWRRRLHFIYLLLLVGGLGIIVYGAYFGGEMIYRHGVGVESAAADGEAPAEDVEAAEVDWSSPADVTARAAYYAPPLQVHLVLAGATVSLALAALGASLRAGARASEVIPPTPEVGHIGMALNPHARAVSPTVSAGISTDELRRHGDGSVGVDVTDRPKSGRFWLLAVLLAVFAAASGAWTLAWFADTWEPQDLWNMVADTETGGMRRLAHVLAGGVIIGLMLLLAIASRLRGGRRFVVSLLGMGLVVAVGAQIWFGSLMMFDSTSGPLGSFNGAAADSSDDEAESPQSDAESKSEPSTKEPTSDEASPVSPATTTPAPSLIIPPPVTTAPVVAPIVPPPAATAPSAAPIAPPPAPATRVLTPPAVTAPASAPAVTRPAATRMSPASAPATTRTAP